MKPEGARAGVSTGVVAPVLAVAAGVAVAGTGVGVRAAVALAPAVGGAPVDVDAAVAVGFAPSSPQAARTSALAAMAAANSMNRGVLRSFTGRVYGRTGARTVR